MIDTRYKKLTGSHAGHTFIVTGPASEIDTPMTWSLRGEGNSTDRLTVNEDELANAKLWQALK